MKDSVSLEVARKLKEAGWEQDRKEPGFFHRLTDNGGLIRTAYWEIPMFGSEHRLAAPTIGEMLEALYPVAFLFGNATAEHEKEGKWGVACQGQDTIHNDNPADALADLWISLKEKGIIKE